MARVTIDGDRLWEGLMALGEIGDRGDGAMMRVTGSDADLRARDHLVDRLEAAGLEVRVDRIGNIYGRRPGETDGPPVLTGSHLDTVPAGGKFDGAAGVVAAIEVVKAWNDAGVETRRPVEVVAFTEEEGTRFGAGLLGSAVASGTMPTDEALSLEDDDGHTVEAVLEEIGYLGEAPPVRDALAGYVELHVEQGPTLDATDTPVGLVEAITGLSQYEVTYRGEANHAGATSMSRRRDPVAGFAETATAIEAKARELAEETDAVATIGRIEVEPGGANVIPHSVRFTVDVRDTDESVRRELKAHVVETMAWVTESRGLELAAEEAFDIEATPMDPEVIDALEAASSDLGIGHRRLPSGGGHDAMHMADVGPAAMVFIPSEDGISHSPAEWTEPSDLAAGTQVLERGLRQLATAP